jgi:hypothetical protein
MTGKGSERVRRAATPEKSPDSDLSKANANHDAGAIAEPAISDFVADNPGLTLFHCRQQLHVHFAFTALLKYP